MFIKIIVVLFYLFGLLVVISNVKRDGRLLVSDLLMLLIAPCLVIPVIVLRVASIFINVDRVIKFYY